jgi:hypothetical protein
MRRVFSVLLLALTACKGADGSTGPAGPSGALNRFDASGVFTSTGSADVTLPVAAAAGGRPPIISCYTSAEGSTWLVIAQTSSSTVPYCGLSGFPNAPVVGFRSGIPGWRYHVVVGW